MTAMTMSEIDGAPTANAQLLSWVSSIAELTTPDKVVWCDGSDAEWDRMTSQLVEAGTFVKLNEAKFEGPIDLSGAFLFLAHVEGLDLSQATGLQQWQIDQACGDAETKLPAGLKTPADWACTGAE